MAEQFEIEMCCLLKVCCGGHNERDAKKAYAAKLHREVPSVDEATAKVVAEWAINTFDHAPLNALKPYRDAVAGMAREYPYSE